MVQDEWIVEMIDIEAAFLEAELDEDIYIEWPEGVEEFGFFSRDERDGRSLSQVGMSYVWLCPVTTHVLQDLCKTSEVNGIDSKSF